MGQGCWASPPQFSGFTKKAQFFAKIVIFTKILHVFSLNCTDGGFCKGGGFISGRGGFLFAALVHLETTGGHFFLAPNLLTPFFLDNRPWMTPPPQGPPTPPIPHQPTQNLPKIFRNPSLRPGRTDPWHTPLPGPRGVATESWCRTTVEGRQKVVEVTPPKNGLILPQT